METPHIVVDAKKVPNLAHFVQGRIKFEVDHTNPEKMLGSCSWVKEGAAFDNLNDHMITMWAELNGWPVVPFDRDKLRPLLLGLLQNTWYQDIQGLVPDTCVRNQETRVAAYLKAMGAGEVKEKVVKEKKQNTGHTGGFKPTHLVVYQITKNAAKLELNGQQKVLLDWFKKNKQGNRAQIVTDLEAAGFRANQPVDRVVAYYLNKWPKLGYITMADAAAAGK